MEWLVKPESEGQDQDYIAGCMGGVSGECSCCGYVPPYCPSKCDVKLW